MKIKKKWVIGISLVIIAIIFSYTQNNLLTTTKITVESNELPAAFDGYKIVQLSDVHSKQFGNEQRRLVKRVNKEAPDIIVVTGDLVDRKKPDKASNILLMKKLVDIAPTYFVTGNHEFWSGKFVKLENDLLEVGVTVLRNECASIERRGEKIHLLGIDDPAKLVDSYTERASVDEAISKLSNGIEVGAFTILLSHRPELFNIYQENHIDLTFSGHAHGGQVRLPFIGGLVAPDQGLFPDYTAGKYVENESVLIVNKGLGNSIIPQRIFNRPEIVSVQLVKD